MAIYCPMYDPERGWYITVFTARGSYKKTIVSPLYYYHSMGVKPPIGSKFSQQDYNDFQLDLLDESYSNQASGFGPLVSFPPPLLVNVPSSHAAMKSELDDFFDLKNPLLSSTAGSASAYGPTNNLSGDSKVLSKETAMLKNVYSLNKKLDAMEKLLNLPPYAGPSGLSLPHSPSSFMDSLAYPSPMSGAKISGNSPFSLSPTTPYFLAMPASSSSKYSNLAFPPTSSSLSHHLHSPSSSMSYLSSVPVSSSSKFSNLAFPSTSSSSSHHLHSLPSTSSGHSGILPPIETLCPHHAAELMASPSSMASTMYDEDMAYNMYLDDVDESTLGDDDYEMSEL